MSEAEINYTLTDSSLAKRQTFSRSLAIRLVDALAPE